MPARPRCDAGGGLIAEERTPVTPLSEDRLLRVSYILGINKALHVLFPNPMQADTWIHRPNDGPDFDGKPAHQRMPVSGTEGLQDVRRYLDGWRQ